MLEKNWTWEDFRSVVNHRLARAQKTLSGDAPIDLVGTDVDLWFRSKIETLQSVVELMPDDETAPDK